MCDSDGLLAVVIHLLLQLRRCVHCRCLRGRGLDDVAVAHPWELGGRCLDSLRVVHFVRHCSVVSWVLVKELVAAAHSVIDYVGL